MCGSTCLFCEQATNGIGWRFCADVIAGVRARRERVGFLLLLSRTARCLFLFFVVDVRACSKNSGPGGCIDVLQ